MAIVINAQTGAATHYNNWPFLGMGQVGDTFLLAGQGGLYAHAGHDDDGLPILAEVCTGMVDCGTPTLKRARAVTLAVAGDGPVQFLTYQEDEAIPVVTPITNVGNYASRTASLPRGTRATRWRFGLRNTDGSAMVVNGIELEMELMNRRGRR